MNSQNEELRTQLKESKAFEKALQQQISTAEEKFLEVNQQYEKLKVFSNAKEVEDQLSSMQRKMINVKSSFGNIDVMKIKYTEEVASYIFNIHTIFYYIKLKSRLFVHPTPNLVVSASI